MPNQSNDSRDVNTGRSARLCLRSTLGLLCAAVLLGAACSEEEEAVGGQCSGGDGAVAGPADTHCVAADGSEIVRSIGACLTAAEVAQSSTAQADAGAEGEADHEHEGDAGHEHEGDAGHEHEGEEDHGHAGEEHLIMSGREADDDDCKYRVSFQNTCVAVNEPVTLTLSLTRKFDGMPGAGTNPAFPEIYLAEDTTHLSPSNDITAVERSPGVYDIGPVVFDSSGRWVVRFHYFETCSSVPEDSPHGHVAFYIDVP